jgi:hypothetical protein
MTSGKKQFRAEVTKKAIGWLSLPEYVNRKLHLLTVMEYGERSNNHV